MAISQVDIRPLTKEDFNAVVEIDEKVFNLELNVDSAILAFV